MHQDFYGTHLGAFVGHSNQHISKTTKFIFSQNSLLSNLAKSCHTDQLRQVQNPPNSKWFVHQDFYGTHLGAFVGHPNHHISKTKNFIFFPKLPTKPSS